MSKRKFLYTSIYYICSFSYYYYLLFSQINLEISKLWFFVLYFKVNINMYCNTILMLKVVCCNRKLLIHCRRREKNEKIKF